MTRSQFMRSVSAAEYTELRALSLIERVGLERSDYYTTTILQSQGVEADESFFRHVATPNKTLDDDFGALAGMVITDDGSSKS